MRGFLNRRAHYAAPLLFFALALGVRFFRLDALSLWLDEGGTWSELSRSWSALIADVVNPRASYPLYHVLMKAWTTLAGDSEWALRFPSAVAGAISVALTFVLGVRLGKPRAAVFAAMLLIFNPAALFYAQDAKVYSVLMAVLLASVLALLRLVEQPSRRHWVAWGAWAAVTLAIHRLGLLSIIGQVVFIVVAGPLPTHWRRWALLIPAALAVVLGFGMAWGLRQDPNAPPIGSSADPLTALVVLWGRLTLDRSPFDLPWLLIALTVLFLIGIWSLWRESQRGERRPLLLFGCLGGIPLLVYLVILTVGVPIFEPRYVAFLLPFVGLGLGLGIDVIGSSLGNPRYRRIASSAVVAAVLMMQGWALFSRPYGLWSGAAIKEDYRTALTTLAERVGPDDAVVVHPPYIKPLYAYYRHRVSANPLPEPLAFGSTGSLNWDQGEFDNDYVSLLADHRRAWLVIAPINAAMVDPPNPNFPQDDMGKVGINFMTADLNGKWRCTDEQFLAFNGVRLLCQSFPLGMQPPSLELTKTWPIPASATAAWGAIRLLGYEFLPWDSGAAYQVGGTLPVHVVWETTQPLTSHQRVFVHLLPALGAPVAAQRDTAPLYGGLPTPLWPVNQPIHDTIAVPLPNDMQPGRYLVVLGWYDPAIPDLEAQRLAVTEHSAPAGPNYIELGTVEVGR